MPQPPRASLPILLSPPLTLSQSAEDEEADAPMFPGSALTRRPHRQPQAQALATEERPRRKGQPGMQLCSAHVLKVLSRLPTVSTLDHLSSWTSQAPSRQGEVASEKDREAMFIWLYYPRLSSQPASSSAKIPRSRYSSLPLLGTPREGRPGSIPGLGMKVACSASLCKLP